MSEHDLYAVLNVERTAARIEIVRAYRRLVRKYHPDTRSSSAGPVNHEAEDRRLQLIMDAYSILADPLRRAEYDQRTKARSGTSQEFVQPVPTWPHKQGSETSVWFYDVPPEETIWFLPPAGLRYRRMAPWSS